MCYLTLEKRSKHTAKLFNLFLKIYKAGTYFEE